MTTKVLRRHPVNFVSGLRSGCMSYVHSAAPSISTFMVLYQKAKRTESVGGDKQGVGDCAYEDDRIVGLYICIGSPSVYTP